MDDAEEPARRRLQRRPGHDHERGQRGGDLLLSDGRHGLGHGGLRGEDDRHGGHERARRALLVLEQAPDVLGVLRLHAFEQQLLLGVGQLVEQVRRVVRVHLLQDVGGAVDVQLGEDLHLVVVGQLLEHVREAFVLQLAGDLDAALLRHVVEHVRQVGGLEVLVRGEEARGPLRVGLRRPAGLVPVQQEVLAPLGAAEGAAADDAAHVQVRDQPVAVALLLQPDVLQEGLARPVGEAHLPVEEVGGHHLLGATAGEPAQVDQPGRDDPARVHGRHPRHRDEDALLAGDLDHEAGGERGCGGAAVQHDDVAQPSQAVAEGVEDVQAQQAGHEDLGGAHRPSLRRAGPRLRVRVRRTAARPGAGPGTMGPCRS